MLVQKISYIKVIVSPSFMPSTKFKYVVFVSKRNVDFIPSSSCFPKIYFAWKFIWIILQKRQNVRFRYRSILLYSSATPMAHAHNIDDKMLVFSYGLQFEPFRYQTIKTRQWNIKYTKKHYTERESSFFFTRHILEQRSQGSSKCLSKNSSDLQLRTILPVWHNAVSFNKK